MTSPDHRSTLDRAHGALRAAVGLLERGSLSLPTPCASWSVAQVIEHAVADQQIWAAAISGLAPPEGDAFAPSGDLPPDVAAMVAGALRRAAQAWEAIPRGVDRVPSPLPQGELDLETARNAAALDAAVHAWDVAAALGGQPVLDDVLAAALLPTAVLLVEPLRQWGAYAAALPTTEHDSPTDTLLGFLGRDPGWAASR